MELRFYDDRIDEARLAHSLFLAGPTAREGALSSSQAGVPIHEPLEPTLETALVKLGVP